MAARNADTADDGFDLTHFLWGDLPLLAGPAAALSPSASASPVPDSFPPPLVATMPGSLTRGEDVVLRERSPAWDRRSPNGRMAPASSHVAPAASVANGDRGNAAPARAADLGIDLDALAVMAGLVGLGSEPSAAAGDDLTPPAHDERPLTYGALTARLQREVLPRLRASLAANGYLTLGHLARAVVDLQRSETHLDDVHAFVAWSRVEVLPSRLDQIGHPLPHWAIRAAETRFADVIGGEIDEERCIDRLGYRGVPLNQNTRAFLVQAWRSHGLACEEEHAYAVTVAADIARVGEAAANWSAEALAAREALIRDNLWLSARMARRYMDRGLALDALLQCGVRGLMQAVVRFAPRRGYRFASYASNWVYLSIVRSIADDSGVSHVPLDDWMTHLFADSDVRTPGGVSGGIPHLPLQEKAEPRAAD